MGRYVVKHFKRTILITDSDMIDAIESWATSVDTRSYKQPTVYCKHTSKRNIVLQYWMGWVEVKADGGSSYLGLRDNLHVHLCMKGKRQNSQIDYCWITLHHKNRQSFFLLQFSREANTGFHKVSIPTYKFYSCLMLFFACYFFFQIIRYRKQWPKAVPETQQSSPNVTFISPTTKHGHSNEVAEKALVM